MKLEQPQTQRRQYDLDVVRVLAIISVTLNHAVNRSYVNSGGQMAEFYAIPLWSTLLKTVVTVFSKLGVPLFLMLTGVLIMNKKMEDKEDIHHFYRHNLLRLLITTEIWYVLIYWYLVLFTGDNMVLETRGVLGAIGGMFETMLFQNQVTLGSMWYMPVIMCIYTTIPFVIMAKNKLSGSKASVWLFLPLILVFVNNMILPLVNVILCLGGGHTFTSKIQMTDLVSYYYIYIFLGYFIGEKVFEKWQTWTVAAIAVGSFVLSCGFQLFMYAQPMDYWMGYDFPLLPLCAGAVMELARRKAHWLAAVRKPVEKLSRMSFGIYFLHIVIMVGLNCDTMDALVHQSTWNPAVKLLYLEIVSVAASVLIISVLSKIKIFRKYLFMIK